jgi:molecular chaperone GrpE
MSDDRPDNSEQTDGEEQAEASPEQPAPTELEKAQEDAAKLKDMLVRTAADFDNFRKRTRRELEDARRGGRDDLLKELLPVFDNLERAIQSAQKATDPKAVTDGLAMIVKQFENTLVRTGIQRVPTIGSMFDPTLHEAIQQMETDEHPPGTVVAEVQPGYKEGERLVRAAMVVVAKPKSS